MDEKSLDIIKKQTKLLLDNVQETFFFITEEQCNKVIVKWPIWKHLYHLLNSLDQWFINPGIKNN